MTPDDGARERAEIAAVALFGDRFLAVLDHELRTPLTPILATVTALENTANMPPSVHAMLARIRRNVEVESRLIDDLLVMTRIARRQLELRRDTLELNPIVLDVVQDFEKTVRNKGLELKVALRANGCFVRGDARRLNQVLANLLSNAVKFTPRGGCVEVESANPRPDVVSVTVTDTGIGIEPSRVDDLFGPFEQVQAPGRRSGGLGLGLTISKGLVEAHGGRMWGYSAGASRGSVFGFELPLVEGRPQPDTGEVRLSRALTILLVEDHLDGAQTIAELLSLAGHRAIIATDMRSAMDLARQPFDVLISDIGLPDGTGLELIQELRREKPVRGIALSAFSSDEDVERSLRAGFCEHLTKPIGLEHLLDVVERVGGVESRTRPVRGHATFTSG